MPKLAKNISGEIDGAFPQPIAEYTDCAKALRECQKEIEQIKNIMFAVGLALERPDKKWEPIFGDGDLYDQATGLMLDVNMIKLLLIDAGLADESEFIPLSPRWRVDGEKHHFRNFKKFEDYVRRIVLGMKQRKSSFKDAHEFERQMGAFKNDENIFI